MKTFDQCSLSSCAVCKRLISAFRSVTTGIDSPRSTGSFPGQSECGASEPLNILLLGPTGVGKTSFINSFYNYICYDTIEEALREGVKVAVASKFTVFCKKARVHKDVQIGDNSLEEENFGDRGESSTQQSKSHVFEVQVNDIPRTIRIIDTPGLGDTRGVDSDKENFRDILSSVSEIGHINGVCILLKPNESRLNTFLEYCITEMFVHFHRNVSKNVVFCFMHTMQTQYSVGETIKPLAELLDRIRKKSGVVIPLDDSTMYCFENEPFRYLAARHAHLNFDVTKVPTESWENSKLESLRLIESLSQRIPHKVEETLYIHKVKEVLENLEEPFGILTTNIEDNLRRMENHKRRILDSNLSIEELRRCLKFKRKVVTVVDLDYFRTVCTSAHCVEFVDTQDGKKIVYKTICHARCSISEKQDADSQCLSGNPILGFKKWCCSAMDLYGYCKRCDCHFRSHVFVNYDIEESEVEEENEEVAQRIRDGQSAVEVTKALCNDADARGKELEMEKVTVDQLSIRFATFLKMNTITPTNDYSAKYWQLQIKARKDMGADPKEILQMEEALQRQQDTVRKSTELLKQGCDGIDVTLQQLNLKSILGDIDRLYNLPLSGPAFRRAVTVFEKSRVPTSLTKSREAVHPLQALKDRFRRAFI